MLVSRDELEFWQIPLSHRDYCAHILVKLTECKRVNYASPFSYVYFLIKLFSII